jgi:hypothetical protein
MTKPKAPCDTPRYRILRNRRVARKTTPRSRRESAGSCSYRDGAAYCVSSLRMILPPAADHGLEGLGVARHRDGLLEDRERRTSG